jgi:hypothetical protein
MVSALCLFTKPMQPRDNNLPVTYSLPPWLWQLEPTPAGQACA